MGFLKQGTDDRTLVEVVRSPAGQVVGPLAGIGKLWLLADRTMVLVRFADASRRSVSKHCFDVLEARDDRRSRRLFVTTADGGEWSVGTSGCGCGLGKVSSTGPIDGPYRLVRVRQPEWLTVV